MEKQFNIQTKGEEIANFVSHCVGTLLSIAGLVVLVVTAAVKDLGAKAVVSAALYGSALVLLYTFSSLYHALTNKSAKKVFRIFDHCSIFILIFGTYIPMSLYIIGGAFGWTIFGIMAFCTVLGIVLNSINLERWDRLSQILYIVMGWMVVIMVKPLIAAIDKTEIIFLVLGGLSYTFGIIFYRNKRIKFMHFIWHIFVIAGSVLQYFSILHYYLR